MAALRRLHLSALALVLLALAAASAVAGCGGGSSEDGGGGGGGRFAAAEELPEGLAGRPAPRIRLQDARSGAPFDTASLGGRAYLVTFLYANCPDVCPLIGQEIRTALGELGPAARDVTAVAVSVDPRGDTREAVRLWLRRQRQPASFRYLIGEEAELAPVWRAFYAAPQEPGNPESAHTAVLWLVDREGRLAGKVSAGAPFEPADLAADLRALAAG